MNVRSQRADVGGMAAAHQGRIPADVYDHAVAWLKAEGVPVEAELAKVDREREYEANRTREAVAEIRALAATVAAAEKKLLWESRGFSGGWAGFNRAKLAEAQNRVNLLAAELDEAC